MTMIERLLAELVAEFNDGSVNLYLELPNSIPLHSVIVWPDDGEWGTESTHGTVQESWQILVTGSKTSKDKGIHEMRTNSLRVRRAVSAVGGHWKGFSGPMKGGENSTVVVSINEVTFSYRPEELLNS